MKGYSDNTKAEDLCQHIDPPFYDIPLKHHVANGNNGSVVGDDLHNHNHHHDVVRWLTHLWYFYLFLVLLLVTQINVIYMFRFLEFKPFLEEDPMAATAIAFSFSSSSSSTQHNDTIVDVEYFQQLSHDSIRRLVNDTEIILWKRTTDKFFEELNISTLIPDIDIERLHGWSDEEKLLAWSDTSRYYIWEPNICFAARNFALAGSVKKHVLFTYVNENRGAFSRDIKGRTAEWNHLATHWSSWGCTEQQIFQYLDHPNTRLVVTTQHQNYEHPKVISIPLGVYQFTKPAVLDHVGRPAPPTRDQLLMINDNGKKHRQEILDVVISNFNHTVNNTYQTGNYRGYVEELHRSKFILAPSGLGWDCYRIWDALYLGTIPIIEKFGRPVDGWRWTLEDLPVLWVDYFDEVTPEYLEKQYYEIAAKANSYNYEKLTRSWWVNFIKAHVPEDKDRRDTVTARHRLDQQSKQQKNATSRI